MPEDPTENPHGRGGENYDEMMSEEPFEEEELDPQRVAMTLNWVAMDA
jgi:hypothetical protein